MFSSPWQRLPADPDVRSFSENRTLGANADWRTALSLGRGTLGVRFGLGGSLHHSAIRILAERIDPGLTTHVESPIREADAYGIVDFQLGRLTLSGGLRGDVVQIPFRNRPNPARDTTSTYPHLSPRAGVSMDVGRGTSVYVSAGRSFRPPAVIELACADPEEPCPLPFALGGTLNLPAGFRFGADARYVGTRWRRGDEANDEDPLDTYFLADARLGFSVRGWEVLGIIRNVLDVRYATFGTFNLNQGAGNQLENFLTPGQPRSFVLTVRREWK